MEGNIGRAVPPTLARAGSTEGSVQREIQFLCEQIERLEMQWGAVVTRIRPVLAPYPVAEPKIDKRGSLDDGRLGSSIAALKDRVAELAQDMAETAGRIEL